VTTGGTSLLTTYVCAAEMASPSITYSVFRSWLTPTYFTNPLHNRLLAPPGLLSRIRTKTGVLAHFYRAMLHGCLGPFKNMSHFS